MELDSGAQRSLRPGLEPLSPGGAGAGGTGGLSVDSGVNTDLDWEEQVRQALESGSRLSQDFNGLKLEQQQEELDFNKHRSDVQKKRDQAVKQHQVLLEKMESVRVKLQLNSSKATRKNFLSKIQDMTSEKNHAQEERDGLAEELSQAEARLSSLQQEQEEERAQWEQDLEELRRQTERAQKDAADAEAKAVSDIRAALERHQDTSDEMIQAWLNQVGVYLGGLRAELPHRHRQEKAQWERREAEVRRSQTELHHHISDHLLKLERHQLETVPALNLPALPQVPMAELYFHRIVQMMPRPPPPAPPLAIVNPRSPLLATPPILLHHAHFPPPFAARPHFHPPPPPHVHPPPPRAPVHAPPPPGQTPPPPGQTPPPPGQTPPPPAPQTPPTANTTATSDENGDATSATNAANVAPPPVAPSSVAPPATAPPPAAPPPAAPPPAAPPATAPPPGAAGKLDKVLEKLGAHLPRCSRAQLTWLLQQVKSERGTLAGLSMEEVVEQVRQRAEATSSARPRPAAAATEPQTAPAPAPTARKPCLVCQKPVDPAAKVALSCSHTVHSDCIRVWLQSSRSHSCPFCPSK